MQLRGRSLNDFSNNQILNMHKDKSKHWKVFIQINSASSQNTRIVSAQIFPKIFQGVPLDGSTAYRILLVNQI